jgi:hypothetical protein
MNVREYDTPVMGYEVTAVLLLKNLVFWDVTVCRMVNGEDTREGRGVGVHKFHSNLEATSKFYAPETGQAASNLQIDLKYWVTL